MLELFFASQNQGKIAELWRALAGTGIVLLTPADIPAVADLDVEESGSTLTENAQLKAVQFALEVEMLTVADDTGLEIAALGGKPGIHSKRYGSPDPDERNQILVREMHGITDRSARFVTVLCLVDPAKDKPVFFEGEVNGRIAPKVVGSAGQGLNYDAIFIPEDYELTFGELGHTIKDQISHRARAVAKLASYLKNHYV